MGADQVGSLVQGPVELKAEYIERARRVAKRIDALIVKHGKARGSKGKYRQQYFELVYDQGMPDSVVPDEVFAEKTLDKFVRWWNEGADARDTVTTSDRHRKGWIAVYAGDMSWGDSPSGTGYGHLSAMAELGLLRHLDIL
jgi:hypothetical protein